MRQPSSSTRRFLTRAVGLAAAGILLSTAPASAQIASTASAVTVQSSTQPAYAWTSVANEGEQFSVSPDKLVIYGAPAHAGTTMGPGVLMGATARRGAGMGMCTNDYFGLDPFVGRLKNCYVDDKWKVIASEGEAFSSAGQAVRYGTWTNGLSSHVGMVVNGRGMCSNAFFGSDPAQGRVKYCEVRVG